MGGMVILVFLAALFATSHNAGVINADGNGALGSLYDSGMLRHYAAADDVSSIMGEISDTAYLSGYNFTVQICSSDGSCSGTRPSSGDVRPFSVLLSGNWSYQPKEVILYVFR